MKLVACRPELKETTFLIEPFDSELPGIYDLIISNNGRHCIFHNIKSNSKASFSFFGDDCKLFEIENSLQLTSDVICDWLVFNLMPSEIEKKYNWVCTGKIASYYERGEGIKGEFIDSWDKIEEFYQKWDSIRDDALKLIREMRELELDWQLRAGQSLSNCFLSRSRRHGLTLEAPYLRVNFLGNNRMVVSPYFGIGGSYFKDLENLDIHNPGKSIFKGEDKRFECEVKYEGQFKELVEKLLRVNIK